MRGLLLHSHIQVHLLEIVLYLQGKQNRWTPYDELALVVLNCHRWDIGLRLKKKKKKLSRALFITLLSPLNTRFPQRQQSSVK